jgi:serine/threonine-protein phosphatase 2A regulatory subunit B
VDSPSRHAIAADGVSTDIVDIKPVNMEELTEVVTSSEFHSVHYNLFVYSSLKSNVKLADTRDATLYDRHAKSGYLHSSTGPKDHAGIALPFISNVYFSLVISI